MNKKTENDTSRRKVCFIDHVKSHEIPNLDLEDITNLYYSKHDFQGFRNDQLFQQNKRFAKDIRRLIARTVSEMTRRIEHADKIQYVEGLLLEHYKNLDREMEIGETREAYLDVEADQVLEDEDNSDELVKFEQEEIASKYQHLLQLMGNRYIETSAFLEASNLLNESCSSLLNFQPVGFEPEGMTTAQTRAISDFFFPGTNEPLQVSIKITKYG